MPHTDRLNEKRITMEIPLGQLINGVRIRLDTGRLTVVEESNRSQVGPAQAGPSSAARGGRLAARTGEELLSQGTGEVSVTEAAQLLGISRQAVLAAIGRSALSARKVGSVYIVDVASISRFSHQRSLRSGRKRSKL